MSDGLFAEPDRIWGPPPPKETAGERLRRRQATAIAAGRHPLGDLPGDRFQRGVLRLHPDASRAPTRDRVPAGAPTCGSCRFRRQVHGGAKDYPKCTWGRTERHIETRFGRFWAGQGPRETHGERSDVRAWWPACVDYEPAERAP